jgi:hypothetical protein
VKLTWPSAEEGPNFDRVACGIHGSGSVFILRQEVDWCQNLIDWSTQWGVRGAKNLRFFLGPSATFFSKGLALTQKSKILSSSSLEVQNNVIERRKAHRIDWVGGGSAHRLRIYKKRPELIFWNVWYCSGILLGLRFLLFSWARLPFNLYRCY